MIYQQALAQKYGDGLHLRIYAVVSIGFERVIWKEFADGDFLDANAQEVEE